jgi:uncharacterized protein YprB with RNaseH-like and TPR domain
MTQLVRGETLTEARLCEEMAPYDLIVTFFGLGFDVPYLQAVYPRLCFDRPHLDLCFAAKQLGLRGGLKHIERMLHIDRAPTIRDMDGWDAVRLWSRWRHRRDAAALELLLAYNEADCVNLQPLADFLYCDLVHRCRPDLQMPRLQDVRGPYGGPLPCL